MDGYDEYEPGTNREVDKAIEITLGNCLLLLTSRPGFLKKPLRDKMDEEIIIQGFSHQTSQDVLNYILEMNESVQKC